MFPLPFPAVLGHEPAGEIVALGSAVTTRKIGDRVGTNTLQSTCGRCEFCQRGKIVDCPEQKLLMIHQSGSHAEYMLAEASATLLLPDTMSFETAAPLLCAGNTVWSGLSIAKPQAEDRVAVLGVGGLGHLAIQYAKAAGYHTIAITRSEDKRALSKELGADEVVADGDELQHIGGADVILSTANSYRTAVQSLRGLRPEGRLVLMGIAEEDLTLDSKTVFPQLMVNRQQIIGSQQNGRQFLAEAVSFAALHGIKPMVETFPLIQAATAYDRVAQGNVRFRAVLVNA
jgi:D-arabinose 1-dehydrogenase-like Zn-dependent alcohol dehydrogenase